MNSEWLLSYILRRESGGGEGVCVCVCVCVRERERERERERDHNAAIAKSIETLHHLNHITNNDRTKD